MKEIIVNIEDPMRLDRYLRTIDASLTQGIIEKALRNGDIKIAGQKISSNYRVENGTTITINKYFHINDGISNLQGDFDSNVISLAKKLMLEYLIYEDENLIAINKPARLATQGGKNINISVDHALSYLNSIGHDLRLVHRLDRNTSGILLIAKTRRAATRLAKAFENHRIEKKYLAITYGKLKNTSGTIRSFLTKIDDKMIEVSEETEDAKRAISDYVLLSSNNGFNLIEFSPKTGRMHQIRAHCAYGLGTPIAGDEKYGDENSHNDLLLHAYKIFIHKEIFQKDILISQDPANAFMDAMKKYSLNL